MSAVYSAEDLAELAGVSTWSIYQAVKADACPFPFLKIGRRIVFPRAAADRLLGIEEAAR
ncbi:MAG: helix-turn-helix domain-containing protein [Actinomycetota bacterium]|nr:helix-turn-helix domain-containing protein [Actinomycetota bacterium]